MFDLLAQLVNVVANLLVIVVIVNVFLSYVVSPYHAVRVALDRILEPILAPIRRVIPPAGMVDFSPMILIVLIEVLSRILVLFLHSI